MAYFQIFLILGIDLSCVMLATGRLDPPKDIRIDIIDNTAKISWMIPSNQMVYYSRIYLNNSKEGEIDLDSERKHRHKDIRFPHSSFEIENLKMCSEYYVSIQCKSRHQLSEFTTQKFGMTNTTFTAEIDENVALTWRTSFSYDDIFYVTKHTRRILFGVYFGSRLVNNKKDQEKYKFDNMPQDERFINITVISVKQTDAGLYGSVDDYERNAIGCCVLVVTTEPMNPVLTIDHEHPFVNNNITFTCNSTVQRWPGYIPSNLSYQYFGNPRGDTDGNKLILNTLTKSDKGITISCHATDDLGKVSNMSESIILDPYYGPDIIVLKPKYEAVNVTEGTILGPIHCNADCNPKCIFNWKVSRIRHFALVHSNQYLTVVDIKKNQAGIYRCSVVHPYDITMTRRIDLVVNVQYSPKIIELWLSDNNETYEWSNATIYSFSEDVNLKIRLRIESNPDPQLVLSSSLMKFPPLRYTKRGIEFLSELPSLTCEDSGNYTIQAFNGIKYGNTRTVNLMIYCKPRNVIADFKRIKTKVNKTENIVMQVVSFPKPTVKWTRTTGFFWMVQKDRYNYRYRIYSSIHIKSKDDFGEYGIHVCNRFGCIEEIFTITYEDDVPTVKNENPGMFAAGITTLVFGLIALIPGTFFAIRKCLKTMKKISVQSDEYTDVKRSNPAFSDQYSSLQPQSESRPLQEPSNDTYEEFGITPEVAVYQNIEEGSGKEKKKTPTK
ncbi:uncharacterized protein LOC127700214 isoform X1 [Mytilus californianus]|uniref:uncharacterized protein LOC127700214 isoform X1 n=1 Tax=Mytilus californianus TaxID=6549 RepID=UPI002245AB2B|nr:uncharacterized protein LOC127700214 isoform X1 [Mytilus californianus]